MKKTNDLEKRLQVLEDKFLALEESIEDDDNDLENRVDFVNSESLDSMDRFINSIRAALEQYDQDTE